MIKHMKNNYGSDQNWFLGEDGDRVYALMLGYGFNMRKLLRAFSLFLFFLFKKQRIGLQASLKCLRRSGKKCEGLTRHEWR